MEWGQDTFISLIVLKRKEMCAGQNLKTIVLGNRGFILVSL